MDETTDRPSRAKAKPGEPGVPDAIARLNPVASALEFADRLVPPTEGMRIVGVRSRTTFHELIRRGELPPLIKRGRNSFHLESELQAYVKRLAVNRAA